MKGRWLDAKKNSAKTGGAVLAEECKPHDQVRITV